MKIIDNRWFVYAPAEFDCGVDVCDDEECPDCNSGNYCDNSNPWSQSYDQHFELKPAAIYCSLYITTLIGIFVYLV